jgi:DNA-binding transcriptional MerR regulator
MGSSGGAAIRQRGRLFRQREKHRRPKTPPANTGWLMADLARLTGISLRTVRYYVELGLLQPIELRGTATRYARRELFRLLCVLRMKTAPGSSLSAIKKELDTLDEDELEAWLSSEPLPQAVAAALGLDDPSALVGRRPVLEPSPVPFGLSRVPALETWHRIRLLPGLELMVSSEASAAVRGIAQKIYQDCVAAER